ncbi:hypothetical protein [Robertkochia sediminum]|uniref:hypothetical protein n=1 Tax=Robertkochia sediminum TaxID=2785326 RepID=UPI001932843F|nr:hypothetical protein [Robertkochia sediminum]MBL7471786.1 hypothetical protein [Robertkochia sediminum]
MKNVFKLLFAGVTMLAFAQCGSSQVFETDPPFSLDACHIEPWTAGEQKEFHGVNLFFPVKTGKDVLLDTVYFTDKKAPLQRIQRDSYLVYKAVIDMTNAPYDIIAHADPKEEFGNRPPRSDKSPFDLQKNEAVISYSDAGVRKYFKVTGLLTSPALHYPERPKIKN